MVSPSALVSNVQDAIVVLDETGKVVFESPSAGEILGIPPSGVLTAFGLDRIHPDDREPVVRSFERCIAVPGSVARATYRFLRADGSWEHLEALAKNLLDDPALGGVLITFRDVTDRIRALESARLASAARDEFLARMSHEMRTPLHAILGWAQLLAGSLDARAADAAEQIADAGRHLLRLVDDSIDLAAIQEGRIALRVAELDIATVVQEAVELTRPIAGEREIAVLIAQSGAGLRVRADRDRLRQVLLNLLANAVKFNRLGGEVVVDVRDAAGTVHISVSDQGPGIPTDDLGRLFERYVRLDAGGGAVPGHGLGLAIARRLVELMEGTIGVESSPGHGATFRVELPSALHPPPSAPVVTPADRS